MDITLRELVFLLLNLSIVILIPQFLIADNNTLTHLMISASTIGIISFCFGYDSKSPIIVFFSVVELIIGILILFLI